MKFTLLQWNTWYKEDPNKIASFIKDIDPDIACLQEITINHPNTNNLNVPDLLVQETGMNGHFKDAQYWPTEKGKAYQGNMILSRFPIINKSHHFVQDMKHDNFDDYSTEGRVVTEVSLDIEGTDLKIATTHLSYTHKFIETNLKFDEEKRLLDYVKKQEDSFVLTGDFNVTPKSKLINDLSSLLNNAGPDFEENTWTTKPFDYLGFQEIELNWRLDYVFHGDGVKAVSSDVLKTDFSDHLPLLVTFEFLYH